MTIITVEIPIMTMNSLGVTRLIAAHVGRTVRSLSAAVVSKGALPSDWLTEVMGIGARCYLRLIQFNSSSTLMNVSFQFAGQGHLKIKWLEHALPVQRGLIVPHPMQSNVMTARLIPTVWLEHSVVQAVQMVKLLHLNHQVQSSVS